MAIPTFTLAANNIQFTTGFQYPEQGPVELLQIADRTSGGSLQIEDLGVSIKTKIISFDGLPRADFINLQYWFENVCHGAENTFTYMDPYGSTFTVRWVSSIYDLRQMEYDWYQGQIVLEVVS